MFNDVHALLSQTPHDVVLKVLYVGPASKRKKVRVIHRVLVKGGCACRTPGGHRPKTRIAQAGIELGPTIHMFASAAMCLIHKTQTSEPQEPKQQDAASND